MVVHSGRLRTRPRYGCRISSTLSIPAGRTRRKTRRYGLSASDCSGSNGHDLAGTLDNHPLPSALLPLGLLQARLSALQSLRGWLGRLVRAAAAPVAGAGLGPAPPLLVAGLLGGALRADRAAARRAPPPRGHGLSSHGRIGMPPSKARALDRPLRALALRRHALRWSEWSVSGRKRSAGRICGRQQRGRPNGRPRKRHRWSANARYGSGRRAWPRRLRLLRLRRRTQPQRGLGLRPRLGSRPLRRRHPRRLRRRHPRPLPRGLLLPPHPRHRHRLRRRHLPLRRRHGLGRRRLRLPRLRRAERRRDGRRRRQHGGLGPLPLASARFRGS